VRAIDPVRPSLLRLYDHPNVVIGCWIGCFLLGRIIMSVFAKASG
jgi:hypothetical protein